MHTRYSVEEFLSGLHMLPEHDSLIPKWMASIMAMGFVLMPQSHFVFGIINL